MGELLKRAARRNLRAVALVGTSILILHGCGAPRPAPADAPESQPARQISLEQLADPNFARRLSGAELSVLAEDGLRIALAGKAPGWPQSRELFGRGGKYILCGHQGPTAGTYSIEGDEICTTTGGAMSCRSIYREADGRSLQYRLSVDRSYHLINEIVLTPHAYTESCAP